MNMLPIKKDMDKLGVALGKLAGKQGSPITIATWMYAILVTKSWAISLARLHF